MESSNPARGPEKGRDQLRRRMHQLQFGWIVLIALVPASVMWIVPPRVEHLGAVSYVVTFSTTLIIAGVLAWIGRSLFRILDDLVDLHFPKADESVEAVAKRSPHTGDVAE